MTQILFYIENVTIFNIMGSWVRLLATDKDSTRPSKQPRTALINDLLQPSSAPKEEKQNGKVRDDVQLPLSTERLQSTSGAVEPELRDVKASTAARSTPTVTVTTTPAAAAIVPPVGAVPSQPLYIKQEPNGKVVDAKPVVVLPPESNSRLPGPSNHSNNNNNNNSISTHQPTATDNLEAQRQSPDADAAVGGGMLVLKQPSAWSDVPDEDWLFAGRPTPPKPKAEVERGAARSSLGLEEPSLQVWSEAVFLPSCDLFALPYVVPY